MSAAHRSPAAAPSDAASPRADRALPPAGGASRHAPLPSAAEPSPPPLLPGLPGGRTLVVGVLNTTPDSFSDGGAHHVEGDPGPAVRRGLDLVAAGADVVDVGGESTRPGASRVPPQVEADRVLPVVAALAARGVVVSVDTTRASVARAAVAAGARIVNDVSGGLADPAMLPVVADLMGRAGRGHDGSTGAAGGGGGDGDGDGADGDDGDDGDDGAPGVLYVAMHWRGPSDVMDSLAGYDDEGGVVAEVERALAARRQAAVDAGLDPARVVLDPGLGFAKRGEHDLALLAALPRLVALGPLLVGASRKRFLGTVVGGVGVGGVSADGAGGTRPPVGRDDATAAVTALAAHAGAWAVRVHEPRASADAVRVVAAVRAAASPPVTEAPS